MVVFFRYSAIDILSVRLPPSVLQFTGHVQQSWLKKEVAEVSRYKSELDMVITYNMLQVVK